jgi:UDP-N-acetylmuramyl tripeptide synthase
MLARLAAGTGAQVLTYGAGPDADIVAERVKSTVWETEVLVRTPVGRLEIIQPLVGRFNVANILAAVGVGLALGVKLVSVVAGIEAVDIVPGRCELVDEGQPFPVVVDAAATPEQLSRLIDDIKEAGARRTLLVLGCPGSSSKEHRAAMGSMAHFKSDLVFLTNDSPGADLPDEIISDIVAGFPDDVLARHAGSYHGWLQDPHRVPPWFQRWLLQYQAEAGRYIIEDRFSAIRVAVGMARARDVVVIAGRGHLDFVEVWDGQSAAPGRGGGEEGDTQTVRAWLDDRVEARNTVSRLDKLYKLKDLDRNAMPWTRYPEEREWLVPAAGMAGDAAAGGSGQYMEQYLRGVADEAKAGAAADEDEEEDEDEEDGDDDGSF